jgi:predicted nuclease of predicted toxin-antitoxin system
LHELWLASGSWPCHVAVVAPIQYTTQLPAALARRIESLAHQAEHGFDLDLARASDDHIRATAAGWGAVIVTQDFAASFS